MEVEIKKYKKINAKKFLKFKNAQVQYEAALYKKKCFDQAIQIRERDIRILSKLNDDDRPRIPEFQMSIDKATKELESIKKEIETDLGFPVEEAMIDDETFAVSRIVSSKKE